MDRDILVLLLVSKPGGNEDSIWTEISLSSLLVSKPGGNEGSIRPEISLSCFSAQCSLRCPVEWMGYFVSLSINANTLRLSVYDSWNNTHTSIDPVKYFPKPDSNGTKIEILRLSYNSTRLQVTQFSFNLNFDS